MAILGKQVKTVMVHEPSDLDVPVEATPTTEDVRESEPALADA